MANAEYLKAAALEATPKLENALSTEELTSMLSKEVQLRFTQCGLATAALQAYLLETHDIPTKRSIIKLPDAPRGLNFRTLSHVVLETDDHVIDPTYGQFMNFVGLTPKSADQHNVAHLYPKPKILVFPKSKADIVAETFARHAHKLDEAGVIPEDIGAYAPVDALRGANFDEKLRVYSSVWTPQNYNDFPLSDQPEGFQEAARRVVSKMKN